MPEKADIAHLTERLFLERIMRVRRRKYLLFFVCCAWICACPRVVSAEKYVAALDLTPVLNTPDMRSVFGGKDGRTLAVDDEGAVQALEFIALPGTVFTVHDEVFVNGEAMYRVDTMEYPYETETGYFIPAVFVRGIPAGNSARTPRILSAEDILFSMTSWIGLPYVWGGNAPEGVAGLMEYFLVRPGDAEHVVDQWALKGLDCSGLLYAATDGLTPRNTSALVVYGDPVEIEGLSAKQIAAAVKPLDLIVWKGHAVIVLDGQNVIESRMDHEPDVPGQQGGVRVRRLEERLNEILAERSPVNDYGQCGENKRCFVIRRWYDQASDQQKNLKTEERKEQP